MGIRVLGSAQLFVRGGNVGSPVVRGLISANTRVNSRNHIGLAKSGEDVKIT